MNGEASLEQVASALTKAKAWRGGSPAESSVFRAIREERERQERLHGHDRDHGMDVWYAILGEEVGEAAKAILELRNAERYPDGQREMITRQALLRELVQVAAVAVAMYERLEGNGPHAHPAAPEDRNPTHPTWSAKGEPFAFTAMGEPLTLTLEEALVELGKKRKTLIWRDDAAALAAAGGDPASFASEWPQAASVALGRTVIARDETAALREAASGLAPAMSNLAQRMTSLLSEVHRRLAPADVTATDVHAMEVALAALELHESVQKVRRLAGREVDRG